MKNKTNNYYIGIASIVILLIIIIVTAVLFSNEQMTIVLTGTKCPSGYVCKATPILDCTTPSFQKRVSFRQGTNWVSVDTNFDGKVDRCFKLSSFSLGSQCVGQEVARTAQNDKVMLYNNGIIVCGSNKFYDVNDNICEMSVIPLVGYENKEGYFGNINIYQCSKNVYVNDVVVQTLLYSSSLEGKIIRGNVITLTEGQIIKFDGDIEWATPIKVATTTCEYNNQIINAGDAVCVENIAFSCSPNLEGGDSVRIIQNCTSSSQTCDNGKCKYSTSCAISGELNLAIDSKRCSSDKTRLISCKLVSNQPTIEITNCYLTDEVCDVSKLICTVPYQAELKVNNIIIDSSVKSVQINAKQVIPIILKLTTSDTSVRREFTASIQNGNSASSFTKDLTKTLNLAAPLITGDYILDITLVYSDTNTYQQQIKLKVVEPPIVNIITTNPIQFDNYPISVRGVITENSEKIEALDWKWQATYTQGGADKQVIPSSDIKFGTGIYEANFNLKGPGTLKVQFSAQSKKSGVWSDWSKVQEITINSAGIIIIPHFVSGFDSSEIPREFTFDTQDQTGAFIKTTNNVIIISDEGSYQPSVSEIVEGKYKFEYAFTTGGLYTIKVHSSSSKLGTADLYDINNPTVEGLSVSVLGTNIDKDCTLHPELPECNKPSYWWIWIVVSIVIVISAIIFFTRDKKK